MNLERRIKQKIWAPEHDFFAVTAPGLEDLCALELAQLGAGLPQPQPGGVAFTGRLELLYRAHLCLRTAGRLLWRLSQFRLKDWGDLAKAARSIPWELFLPPGCGLEVRVSLQQTCLRHQGQAGQEVFDAAVERLKALDLAPPRPAQVGEMGAQAVLLRGVEQKGVISLDATGDHLHFRGYRLASGKAPLREDLAAALLILCGYDGSEPLLDPMCGAGTLVVEAACLARRLPSGANRSFAFQTWPNLRLATWQYLTRQASQAGLDQAPHPLVARDHLAGALNLTRDNARRAGVLQDLSLERADFFQAPPPWPGPGLLVVNPPYGKRLGSVPQAEDTIKRLAQRLTQHYAGWRLGVVLSLPQWADFFRLRHSESLVVPHGGSKVTLLSGTLG